MAGTTIASGKVAWCNTLVCSFGIALDYIEAENSVPADQTAVKRQLVSRYAILKDDLQLHHRLRGLFGCLLAPLVYHIEYLTVFRGARTVDVG